MSLSAAFDLWDSTVQGKEIQMGAVNYLFFISNEENQPLLNRINPTDFYRAFAEHFLKTL